MITIINFIFLLEHIIFRAVNGSIFFNRRRRVKMKLKLSFLAVMALTLLVAAGPAFSADTQELERKIDLLSDEVDDLKSRGIGAGTTDHNRVSVHGYGELHLNHVPGRGDTQIDNHRFAIGVHALLTDWIHLNAEFDFEHGAQELELELAYLDFLLDSAFNVRAGVMLAPVGLLNETHEPNLFWTVERPLLQERLIPTSWNGGGAGIFGTPMDGVSYRVYAMNSLQSIAKAGASAGAGNGNGGATSAFDNNGIRGGRGQVNNRIADDFSVFARVELTRLFPGLQVGLSVVNGDTTHDIIDEGGNMTLLEADVRYRWNWFDMNASIVNIDIDDAAALNTFCATSTGCSGGIAENNFGYNIQAGIHLPQLLGWKTSHDIIPHFMFERVRTQDEMPTGTAANRARNRDEVYTFGVAYLPTPSVSLKTDYTVTKLGDNTSTDQFNVGIAYMY